MGAAKLLRAKKFPTAGGGQEQGKTLEGIKMRRGAVQRHRRGSECGCGRRKTKWLGLRLQFIIKLFSY